jgi:hypothetical protein
VQQAREERSLARRRRAHEHHLGVQQEHAGNKAVRPLQIVDKIASSALARLAQVGEAQSVDATRTRSMGMPRASLLIGERQAPYYIHK